MWYLVLIIYGQGSAATVIPEKYPTDQACKNAGERFDRFRCIPAPERISKLEPIIGPKPGYYCGQFPDECKIIIDNMPKCNANPTSGKLECN